MENQQSPVSTNLQNTVINPTVQVPSPSSSDIPPVIITPKDALIDKPKKSNRFFWVFLTLFVFTLIGLTTGVLYAVAYEKIKLPEKFISYQTTVSDMVISMPFMPKTPKFLITKTLFAHSDVKKESFDISVASESDSFIPLTGFSGMDAQLKGKVDYSDTKNPKFTLNASLSKDFNFEIVKPSSEVFFKINKFPVLLFSFMGINEGSLSPILSNWYKYDATPLNTPAREDMELNKKEPLSQKYILDNIEKYLDREVLSQMTIIESEFEGFEVYQLTVNFNKEMIDSLGKNLSPKDSDISIDKTNKLSDTVKSLSVEIDIDKSNYYNRRTIIRTELEVDEVSPYGSPTADIGTLLPTASKVALTFVAKFSDFGSNIVFEEPENAGTWEDFTTSISEIFSQNALYGM